MYVVQKLGKDSQGMMMIIIIVSNFFTSPFREFQYSERWT